MSRWRLRLKSTCRLMRWVRRCLLSKRRQLKGLFFWICMKKKIWCSRRSNQGMIFHPMRRHALLAYILLSLPLCLVLVFPTFVNYKRNVNSDLKFSAESTLLLVVAVLIISLWNFIYTAPPWIKLGLCCWTMDWWLYSDYILRKVKRNKNLSSDVVATELASDAKLNA